MYSLQRANVTPKRLSIAALAVILSLGDTLVCCRAAVAAEEIDGLKKACWSASQAAPARIEACTSIINSDLQSFTALYYRGVARDEAGDRNGALADLNEAIRLNPSYVAAIYSRGVVYGELNDLDHAIANYDNVLRLEPAHYLALNNRGAAWKNKGDADRAIADFTEAFRVNPEYLAALFNRAITRDKKGTSDWGNASPAERDDMDRALADYNELVQLSPNSAGVYYRRAHLLERKGTNAPSGQGPSFEDVVRDLDTALRISPDHLNARLYRGWLVKKWYMLLPDGLDRAVSDFDYVIAKWPNIYLAYTYPAEAYIEKGDLDHALTDYSESIRLHPDRDAHLQRAKLWEQKSDFSKAQADRDAANKFGQLSNRRRLNDCPILGLT